MTTNDSTEPGQKKLFWLALFYLALLIATIALVSRRIWGGPNIFIAYVPISIWEWAFIGGMIGVLYRLAYQRNTAGFRLYTWIIAKPVIGTAMGAVVYFLAMAGAVLVGGRLPTEQGELTKEVAASIYWLNALAFIGGFSDRFSIDLINRFTAGIQTRTESHQSSHGDNQSTDEQA